MAYIAVVAWTNANRIAKYADYATEADATAHVNRVKDTFPGAFVVSEPNAPCTDWLIDPTAKTVSVSPVPEDPNVVAERQRQEGITTDTDYMSLVDKAKTASATQIESYIDSLFSGLSVDQRAFLKALVFIAIMNPQLRG